jgi:hypothetical protein
MVEGLAKKINYWVLVLLTVMVIVLGYYRYKEENTFQEAGSRFTGEDAIWLLENSNIKVNPDAKIDGLRTPFRDFINRGF